MLLLASYHLGCAKVIDIHSAERRLQITRSERCKALKVVIQALGDVAEIYGRINLERRLSLHRFDVFIDISMETTTEFRHILPSESKSTGIGMTAKID